jgi:hypothetical protein
MEDTRKMPPMTGSVDLSAFHAAAANPRTDLNEALAAATEKVEPPAPIESLTKAELLDLAHVEGVDVPSGMTKADVAEAIEARRAGDDHLT